MTRSIWRKRQSNLQTNLSTGEDSVPRKTLRTWRILRGNEEAGFRTPDCYDEVVTLVVMGSFDVGDPSVQTYVATRACTPQMYGIMLSMGECHVESQQHMCGSGNPPFCQVRGRQIGGIESCPAVHYRDLLDKAGLMHA